MAHGEQWYIPDIHIVIIDIEAFVPLLHQGLYPGVAEVSCLILVYVAITCQPVASYGVQTDRHILGHILLSIFMIVCDAVAVRLLTTIVTALIARPVVSTSLLHHADW